MGRPTADTVQITFRVPTHWVTQAEAVATVLARHGMEASRTDVFREALARGMDEIIKDEQRALFRVSAWDGRKTTCLFWFGRDEQEAIARAKELAREHETRGDHPTKDDPSKRWTVFRVYKGDDPEPIHFELVSHGATASARLHSRATALTKELDRKPAKRLAKK